MLRSKPLWVIVSLLLVLVVANTAIWQKERLLADGKQIFLRLAPVDPRSLMQGDYMTLNFELLEPLRQQFDVQQLPPPAQGRMVLRIDDNGEGHFVRLYDKVDKLAADEHLLSFHRQGVTGVGLATDAFFFQEGLAERYQRAVYGVFRVAANGQHLLSGLADENRQLILPNPAFDASSDNDVSEPVQSDQAQ